MDRINTHYGAAVGGIALIFAAVLGKDWLTQHHAEWLLPVLVIFGFIGIGFSVWGVVSDWRAAHSRREPAERPLPKISSGKFVKAADFAPAVEGRIFRNCEVVGTVHFPGSHVTKSKLVLGKFDVVKTLKDGTLALPPDTCSFINCTFKKCEFTNCTVVGTSEQIASLKATLSWQ